MVDQDREQTTGIREEFNSRKIRLGQSYAAHLEGFQKQLTIANQIENAVQVKELIKQIPSFRPDAYLRPVMPKGAEARDIPDAVALEQALDQTTWRLVWTGNKVSGSHELLTFHYGRIVSLSIEGKPTERYLYEIKNPRDLSFYKQREKRHHVLRFDPSLTRFNLTEDDRFGSYRQGRLVGPLHAEGDTNFLQDLLLYYKFDTPSRVVKDHGSYGNDGMAQNTLVAYWGKRQNAYRFENKDSWVLAQDPIDPDQYASLSIAFWINPLYDRGMILGWKREKDCSGTYFSLNKYRLACNFGSDVRERFRMPSVTLKKNEWTHIAFVHDEAGGDVLYVNGKHVGSSVAYPLKNNAPHLRIAGDHGDGSYYHGYLDDLMIFKRALSSEQVKMLYDRD